MIRDNRIGENINGEDGGQFFDPLSDPFFSVGVIVPRELIDSAEEGPTNASLDNM
jgi:hypothetical protein